MTMNSQGDNRRVALIKSSSTKNRFYALVEPERGIKNADMIDHIPDDVLLGIAYPCLEDGLNDFAVIRTTFETLDYFPADDPIWTEMKEIIDDARSNLVRRLNELRDRIAKNMAWFLGTDYDEFKEYSLAIVTKGYPRQNLDAMMKLNVFRSVAEAEGHTNTDELTYFFEFQYHDFKALAEQPAQEYIVSLFDEVLRSVTDDDNYRSKYLFDKFVFQKFIAVMFVNYATTDPMFYGINRRDYGVSGDKDMDDTPLYKAIARELKEIEIKYHGGGLASHPAETFHDPSLATPVFDSKPAEPDFSLAADLPGTEEPPVEHAGRVSFEQASAMLPDRNYNDDIILGPITSLCSAAQLLRRKNDPETQRFARVILADASKLILELKRLNIISPLANDPGDYD